MDHGRANVVGVCLAGSGDWHFDWPGGWLHLWFWRHYGQYSDGVNADGHGFMLLNLPVSIWAYRAALTKRFDGYQLALVEG